MISDAGKSRSSKYPTKLKYEYSLPCVSKINVYDFLRSATNLGEIKKSGKMRNSIFKRLDSLEFKTVPGLKMHIILI